MDAAFHTRKAAAQPRPKATVNTMPGGGIATRWLEVSASATMLVTLMWQKGHGPTTTRGTTVDTTLVAKTDTR